MAVARLCSIPGCGKKHEAKGFCIAHYTRLKRYGDPHFTKTAPTGEPPKFYFETVLPYEGDDCLIWPFDKGNDGYGRLWLNDRKNRVSRLACEEVNGPPPAPDYHAAHSCGNGHLGCVNPRHLRWDTYSGNFSDKVEHGTHNRGERHNFAKITEIDVERIRRLRQTTTIAELASMFGISQAQISRIANGRRWKHIEP